MGVISEEIEDAQDDGDASPNPAFFDQPDPFGLDYNLDPDDLPVDLEQAATGVNLAVNLTKIL